MIQRRVFVTGKVQGVGFRVTLLQEAQKYASVRGFVQNLKDGRVETVLAGLENEVLPLVAWCVHGPFQAHILEIEVKEESFDSSFENFLIL